MIIGDVDPNQLEFELSQPEIERLKKVHNAMAVKEMTEHPGWPLFITISQDIIGRMETEHLNSAAKMDRDRYWIQGAELSGARKYARLLTEIIAHQIAALDQNYVPRDRRIDIADLDGDFNGEND